MKWEAQPALLENVTQCHPMLENRITTAVAFRVEKIIPNVPPISRRDSFANLCPFPSFCFGLFEHKRLQIMGSLLNNLVIIIVVMMVDSGTGREEYSFPVLFVLPPYFPHL